MTEKTTVWEVFIQSKNGLAHKHAGNVHATDKIMALENARELKGHVFGLSSQVKLFLQNQKIAKHFLIPQMTKCIDIQHFIPCLMAQNIFK